MEPSKEYKHGDIIVFRDGRALIFGEVVTLDKLTDLLRRKRYNYVIDSKIKDNRSFVIAYWKDDNEICCIHTSAIRLATKAEIVLYGQK